MKVNLLKNILAKIVKRKDGYYVLSEKGRNLGGPYSTREEAEKRLRQVEYFKHKKGYRITWQELQRIGEEIIDYIITDNPHPEELALIYTEDELEEANRQARNLFYKTVDRNDANFWLDVMAVIKDSLEFSREHWM